MIVAQDLVDAAGSQEALVEVFSLAETTDPETDPKYAAKVEFALSRAHAILIERLGVTFDATGIAGLDPDDQTPLVHLGARFAVLEAKLRGRGRLEEAEDKELTNLLERLDDIRNGRGWPGVQRPASSAVPRPQYVARSTSTAGGFFPR